MARYFSSAQRHGKYNSGLEFKVAQQLEGRGVPFEYETTRLYYVQPAKVCFYRPDFILPNGIIVEAKGLFPTDDRQKHKFLKALHPNLDVRFVFSRSAAPINSGSPTTLSMWCDRYGHQCADKLIPASWLVERVSQAKLDAIAVASDKSFAERHMPPHDNEI